MKSVILKGKGASAKLTDSYISSYGADVWTLNDDIRQDSTLHFELHDRSVSPRVKCRVFDATEAAKVREIVPYMPFTCTPCYMIAEAYLRGYDRILLPGMDFINTKERRDEVQGINVWIGFCHGIGLQVIVPPNSSIMKFKTYLKP